MSLVGTLRSGDELLAESKTDCVDHFRPGEETGRCDVL
jgi:hypothetical protein